jgi:hypothetical protein
MEGRKAALAAGLAGLALVTAACGKSSHHPGVAGIATAKPRATSSSGSTGRAGALAYSQCMRAHGLKDFPDPDAKGGIVLSAGPGSDLDFNSPAFKAADNACKSLRPVPTAGGDPARLKAANLAYARCMRAHGVADFPDPSSDGTIQIKAQPGGDLDPHNPVFTKADTACKHLEPDGGQGSELNSGGGGS